jgi:hypothetical protein
MVAAPILLVVVATLTNGPLDPRFEALGGRFDLRGHGGILLVANQVAMAVTTLAVVIAAGSLVGRFRAARAGVRRHRPWTRPAHGPRLQQVVDRHFNRRRHDAGQLIEAFGTRLRDQVDLDTLIAELVAVVQQTMQPTRASLWLRNDRIPRG